ncbi:heat shock factor-binding protein 1-like [Phyllostomus discolor]|uniref:Heat shock factor-binding protein 1 n=1 Tax=Phyllostomus discolor TaxID=89673 RepID=A0A7E6D2L3_9CHIR|nr:heat shock factor-binding protein 1-like [Phyllostomus discolor]
MIAWTTKLGIREMAGTDPKTVQDLTLVVQTPLQQMQDRFRTMSSQIIGRTDDMSSHIDDLEKNIADHMTQAGVEELEAENKVPASQKSRRLLIYTEIWNIIFTKPGEDQMALCN